MSHPLKLWGAEYREHTPSHLTCCLMLFNGKQLRMVRFNGSALSTAKFSPTDLQSQVPATPWNSSKWVPLFGQMPPVGLWPNLDTESAVDSWKNVKDVSACALERAETFQNSSQEIKKLNSRGFFKERHRRYCKYSEPWMQSMNGIIHPWVN